MIFKDFFSFSLFSPALLPVYLKKLKKVKNEKFKQYGNTFLAKKK